jgi:hypothetical protein
MSLDRFIELPRRRLRRRKLDVATLADNARDAGQWELAARLYQQALGRNPRNAAIWIQYGHALKESGGLRDPEKLAQAETVYRGALSLDPSAADPHLQLGHVLKLQGKTNEAEAAYLRAFALDPSLLYPLEELRRIGWSEAQVVELQGILPNGSFPENCRPVTEQSWSGHFDAEWYLKQNDDVARAGMDPLEHFLTYGIREGRKPYATAVVTGSSKAVTSADIQCLKKPSLRDEVVLLVTYSPNGSLKPHVPYYLESLKRQSISVVLIVNTDRPSEAANIDFWSGLDGIFVRQNEGYDFAAWAHVLLLHPEFFQAKILYMVNDSLIGPTNNAALGELLNRIRECSADVVGLTENFERGWHLQSYFLALKRHALSSHALRKFFSNIVSYEDKQDVINEFEIHFAPTLKAAGLECRAIFPALDARNPTSHHWKHLLQSGFPFVKVETIRGLVPDVDISDWRESLAAQGYDVSLAERTLAEITASSSSDNSFRARIEASGLFRPDVYISLHDDLRAGGREGWQHFLQHGLIEGRQFTNSEVVARLLVRMDRELKEARHKFQANAMQILKTADNSAIGVSLRNREMKIGVFCSTEGNFYMREIADLLVWGLQAHRINAVQRDETASKNEPFDLRVFVAPHEFFTLGGGPSWVHLAEAGNSVLYNVEQVQTPWFCRAFPLLLKAPLVLDPNFQSAEILRRAGCNVVHFAPGYLPTARYARPYVDASGIELLRGYASAQQPYNWIERNNLDDRPIDLLFIGTRAPRRDKALARLQDLSDTFRFLCIYVRNDAPLTIRNYRHASSEIGCAIAQRAKIVLNIHRDWLGYFEWSRMVLQGIWQGACVLSDPGLPNPVFQAGVHYLEENVRHLGELARWLLSTEEGRETLEATRMAGYNQATGLGSMRVALPPVLEAFRRVLDFQ